ncbi:MULTISPECIES: hypothetical protein [Bacteria]|uniref:hypothetical protein n=1 Tax=Bacteria TaxID=2 RepID=UPI0021CF7077|nr:hypothetical protein [Streptomyces sp. NEAU-383]
MRRLDKGAPIRDAMQAAGLDIPRLAARTKELDPDGLSKALVGFIVGSGKSAREECSDRAAGIIARALNRPVEELFESDEPISMPEESTSTRRLQVGGRRKPRRKGLPDRLMDQPELATWLKKSMSWIDKQIQETRDLPEGERFPVHYVGHSRRFDPREVLEHCDQARQAQPV